MPKYRHFEQSDGALCKLPGVKNGIIFNAVGTSGCRTCLCVYIKFKDDRVFIAHMVGLTMQEADDITSAQGPESPTQHAERWMCEPAKGEKLKEIVLKQLKSELGEERGGMAVEGLAVCPAIEMDGGKAHGRWMLEAIREFFKPATIELRDGHGFVAGSNVQTELFQWEADGSHDSEKEMGPGSYGWEFTNQRLLTIKEKRERRQGPWSFEYCEGEWGVTQKRQKEDGTGFDVTQYAG